MIYIRTLAEDDGIADDYKCAQVGCDTKDEIINDLDMRADEAVNKGLPNHGKDRLKRLLQDHSSVFRWRLGKDPPAKITPMKIHLDPKRQPVNVMVCRYSMERRKYIVSYFRNLVEYGYI